MSAAGKGYWQRADGLFVAQVTVRSVDGHRRRRSVYGHTAKEVMAKKRAVELEQSQGRATATRRPPRLSEFGASWITDHLAADLAGGRLAESTFAQYRDLWDRHIGPDLGHLRLDELQPPVLRQWLSRKAQATSLATGKPLSARSVQLIHAVLRRALNDAKDDGLLHDNPMGKVKAPRLTRRPVTPLSIEQTARFLAVARADHLWALWLLLLTVGLRVNEALALRWSDLDLEQATVDVRRSLAHVAGERDAQTGRRRQLLVVKSTKVPASECRLALPNAVVDALRSHRAQQAVRRLEATVWQDNDLVFCTAVGSVLDSRNLLKRAKVMAAAAEIPGTFRVHDLRHNAATAMLAEGMPLFVVQKVLRHTRQATTSDIYGHLAAEVGRAAAVAMDDRVARLQR